MRNEAKKMSRTADLITLANKEVEKSFYENY